MNDRSETKAGVDQSGAGLSGIIHELLSKADIQVGGDRPWDMQIHDPSVQNAPWPMAIWGSVRPTWKASGMLERLDEFFYRLIRNRVHEQVQPFRLIFHSLRARLLNLQTARRSWQVGEAHYDLGNDFYQAMLDRRMTYTCGYWKRAKTLDRGTGGQAGPDLPQAGSQTRNAGTGYRLWLGELHGLRRGALRRGMRRCDDLPGTGSAG
jgi:cyclopropane-fatty-acyl-phospholipid synthase